MLTGNIVSFGVGAIMCVLTTYCTRWNMTKEIEEAEWEKTRDIDNPLSPWVQVYKVSAEHSWSVLGTCGFFSFMI